jgi:hypothetical protein
MRSLPRFLALLLVPAIAAAQDRPFLFSFSSTGWTRAGALAYYEPGYAQRAPTALAGDGLEHRVGVEARFASRLSVLSVLGVAQDGGAVRMIFRTEGLYDILGGTSRTFRLSAGGGYGRDADRTSLALARIAADGSWGTGWRAAGNLRFEKPFARNRDEVDVLTSLGLSRAVSPVWSAGVEAVGEDLEALWEAQEAEGGGRVMVGPGVYVRFPESRLSAGLAGGPVFTIRPSERASGADRNLGTGLVVRLSLVYRL